MVGRVLFSDIFFILVHFINLIAGHTPRNNSDVIVTYSGHAEANYEPEIKVKNTTSKPETLQTEGLSTEKLKLFIPEYIFEHEKSSTDNPITEEEDVVFIPNEKGPPPRYGEELSSRNKIRVQDLMQKSVGDILNNQDIRIESNTEATKDIFFISGKNKDTNTLSETKKKETKIETRRSGKKIEILNCTNLDCNNTVSSICGGKYDREWKYRIFLNDCYFRKVNCGFKYAENRYKEVGIEKCKHIGTHSGRTSEIFNPPFTYLQSPNKPVNINITRRTFVSRRAMTKYIDGQGCGHTCPITCPEDYEPECAITPTGNKRVFLNHCKLDFNSCSYGLVWYRRPLSDCVGGQKADMRQNRAFVGWMQKVGIVDNKGRLVLT